MILIRNNCTDPYYNMAAEEYFLDKMNEEAVMLWKNDKTVVIGRNQNTIEEINIDYIKENNIAVVRRLTGGGAVFHDLGNVNFTLIQEYKEDRFNDYAYFTKPICGFLKTLGVNAELSGRNDLLIDGLKISGNAQAKWKNKLLHHGTLLFSADTADLSGALKPNRFKIESKGIKSVKSRTTNISEHLETNMTAEEFFEALYRYFIDNDEYDIKEYKITDEDVRAITALRDSKYGTWEWNYGKSPEYTARHIRKYDFGLIDIRITAKEGIITDMKIFGDFFGTENVTPFEKSFIGLKNKKENIALHLCALKISDYISGMTNEDMLQLLFEGGECESN